MNDYSVLQYNYIQTIHLHRAMRKWTRLSTRIYPHWAASLERLHLTRTALPTLENMSWITLFHICVRQALEYHPSVSITINNKTMVQEKQKCCFMRVCMTTGGNVVVLFWGSVSNTYTSNHVTLKNAIRVTWSLSSEGHDINAWNLQFDFTMHHNGGSLVSLCSNEKHTF